MRMPLAAAILAVLCSTAVTPAAGFGQETTPTVTAALPPVVWSLTELSRPDGSTVVPPDPDRYTLQFRADSTVGVVADCNFGHGGHTVAGSSLTISAIATTKVRCPPGSLGDEFVARLAEVATFSYEDGSLVLALRDGVGSLRFEPLLTGVVWEWQAFQSMDDSVVVPDDPSHYTLSFAGDGTLAVRADCNRGRGTYDVEGSELDLEITALTRAACPPESLADRYLQDLNEATSHVFREGALYLALPMDAGIIEFAAREEEVPEVTPSAASDPTPTA